MDSDRPQTTTVSFGRHNSRPGAPFGRMMFAQANALDENTTLYRPIPLDDDSLQFESPPPPVRPRDVPVDHTPIGVPSVKGKTKVPERCEPSGSSGRK